MRLCDQNGETHELAPGYQVHFDKEARTLAFYARNGTTIRIGDGALSDDKWILPRVDNEHVSSSTYAFMKLICAIAGVGCKWVSETKTLVIYEITE